MFNLKGKITCFLAVCVIKFATVTAIKYSTAEYQCDRGVYQDLYDLTLAVRFSAYAPFLSKLRKKQSYVSGQDVLDNMQHYCAMANEIVDTQKYMMKHIECLKTQVKSFNSMIRKSHSYCLKKKPGERSQVKRFLWSRNATRASTTASPRPVNVAPTGLMEGIGEVNSRVHRGQVDPDQNRIVPGILNIFKQLPVEHLDYRNNPCYYQAPKLAYTCYRRHRPRQNSRLSDLAYRLKRKASSIRCTFRNLARICPRKRAFLITVMEFDWMIVPPPLDVNIASFLLRAWRMKL